MDASYQTVAKIEVSSNSVEVHVFNPINYKQSEKACCASLERFIARSTNVNAYSSYQIIKKCHATLYQQLSQPLMYFIQRLMYTYVT